jgi:uncharacterized integral membrane protein (TIGR00698 family)
LLPGLALCAAIAAAATTLGRIEWFARHGITPLTLAIALGILLGNTVYSRSAGPVAGGVAISKQKILRLGVVLYGMRLTLHDVATVGTAGILVDAIMLASTFAFSWFVGTRWLKLEREAALLIGAGSAICGAAAVMATEPVVRAKSEQVSVAIATVVLFGTLAMFVYPALFALHLDVLPSGMHAFGVYTGSTVHEVAQVFAAANSIGPEAANIAVITKMVRVMMLAPFLLALSFWLRPDAEPAVAGPARPRRFTIPWFAFAFLAVIVLNSIVAVPAAATAAVTFLDNFLLAMAMGALGLTTQVSALYRAGGRPLALAGLLFAWLLVGGSLINQAVAIALG